MITMSAVSVNRFGIWSKLVLLILLLTVACGCGGGKDPEPAAAGDPAYAAVKPTVDRVCGPCHNGSEEQAFDGARFRSSSAKARISAGSMPPGGRISAPDKKTLLDFLNS